MLVSDFDYLLPKELIAQEPVRPRDSSRLLVYEKKSRRIRHRHFFDLPKFLRKGDLLVFNDTKVFKARLFGEIKQCHPRESGDPGEFDSKPDSRFRGNDSGKVEIFLLRPSGHGQWEVLARPGKKLKIGTEVQFAKNLFCRVKEKKENGVIIAGFNKNAEEVIKQTEKLGRIPVPPYVKKEPARLADYQTIYAKHLGSAAAPTAGFHLTPRLLSELKKKGVQTAFVTLHVGLGTFQPVKTEKIEEHKMHAEWVEISASAAEKINRAKKEGRRVIAVGTTTTRALEGTARKFQIFPHAGDINIFIFPGFRFQIIDGLITNFHLPKSTLLMLTAAFVRSRRRTLQIYRQAVEYKYRFYSFGDAMFIC